ncbi:MAG: hypothetical protein ACLFUC_01270 [Bacteroidales bacterium]
MFHLTGLNPFYKARNYYKSGVKRTKSNGHAARETRNETSKHPCVSTTETAREDSLFFDNKNISKKKYHFLLFFCGRHLYLHTHSRGVFFRKELLGA